MNLLSRVTRGPYVLATSNSWRRFVSRDGVPVCEPITYSERDRHPDLHFKNGGEDGPDAQLLAASYDHAMLLAAVMSNAVGLMRITSTQIACDVTIGEKEYPIEYDPFGCPILTDELRAELERLLGVIP